MNKSISKDDFLVILSETLEQGRDFSFTPSGSSMKPMLNGTTDTVMLSAKPEKLKKYDVAMFRRIPDRALILHRIVKVNPDGTYVFSGDNQYFYDDNVSYDSIVAVVKSFNRNGKTITTDNFFYRFYIYLILLKKNIHNFLSKIYRALFK